MMLTAVRYQQDGHPDKAAPIYRKILKAHPDLADASHFLGLALHQGGKTAEGLALMRRSLRDAPANPVYHNNLGFVLKSLGRFDEAEACHREAVRLQPAFAEAWYNLGVALQAQDRLQDAADAYRRAVASRPDYVKAYVNLAGVVYEQGGFDEAIAACEAALARKPALSEAWVTLARALAAADRLDAAVDRLNEALQFAPQDPDLLSVMGDVLAEQGELDAAERVYGQALRQAPGRAEVYGNLGHIAQTRGDHAKALQCFEQALELEPGFAGAYSGMANSRSFGPEDNQLITKIEAALARNGLSRKDKIALHFALGKIYDDSKRYEEAFTHYRAGNMLKRRTLEFDRGKHERNTDAIISVFTKTYLQRADAAHAHDSEVPIFIVGMPRSGTTLVEQILSSHPEVAAGGELPHLNKVINSIPVRFHTPAAYPECMHHLDADARRALAGDYLDRLPRREQGQIRITDKLPGNYLHLGFIASVFSRARIVHCRRDPMDVCLSIYFQLFDKLHPYAYDLDDVGFYYREYQRLMDHWRLTLGERLFEVDYQELVDQPEAASRALIGYCGLEWNDRCLAFHENRRQVKTASQWQVRQPIYRRSLNRWRHYETHLDVLKQALGYDAGRNDHPAPSMARQTSQ